MGANPFTPPSAPTRATSYPSVPFHVGVQRTSGIVLADSDSFVLYFPALPCLYIIWDYS